MNRTNTRFLTVLVTCLIFAFTSCGNGTTPVSDILADVTPVDDASTGTDVPVTTDTTERDAVDDAIADVVVTPAIARFIFVSDVHFRVEDGDMKHSEDIETLAGMVNALAGDFDILITGGDNFDHILPEWDDNPTESPMSWYTETMDTLSMPWVSAIGNHEFYDFFGQAPVLTTDGAKRGQAFATAMGNPLYFTTEVNGIKLIVLNSMEDGSWGETHGLMGKFSADQLDWLRNELDEGKPSFLFFHHPPSSMAAVAPGGHLCDVLEEYPDMVKSIFAGHTHGFWRGTYCGTPYYVVENFHNKLNLWFEIEYDGVTDTVTILNEDQISFPEVPEFSCDPEENTIESPESAVGTVHQMKIENGVTDAEGLGEMLGEGLGEIPFVMSFDGYDAEDGYNAKLTIASRWDVDDFMTYVDGSPCVAMSMHWDEGAPCFEAGPFNMEAQLISFLAAISEDPVNPEWQAMLNIKDMVLEGCIRNSEAGTPVIADGLVYATIIRDSTINDLAAILVDEYCAGRIEGCTPGQNSLPECSLPLDQNAYDSLFGTIRYKCDIQIMGFGLVSLIEMLETLPEETHVTGKITSTVLTVSETQEQGGDVADNLFDTTAGKNCSLD